MPRTYKKKLRKHFINFWSQESKIKKLWRIVPLAIPDHIKALKAAKSGQTKY